MQRSFRLSEDDHTLVETSAEALTKMLALGTEYSIVNK